MWVCVFNTLLNIWAPACSFTEGKGRGSGACSAERPLATMPAQSLQDAGTPIARTSPFPSLPLAFPPTRVYFCQLPYSCLHCLFAHTPKTFLVRADEALQSTVGTPGGMLNRHTSFCRQALWLYKGPEARLESAIPLIVLLHRDDHYPSFGPSLTPPVLWDVPTQAPSSSPAVVRPPYAHITTMSVLWWRPQLSRF